MSLRPRKFMYNGERLADPDPTKTPQEVRDIYAAQHPELTTATFDFSKEGAMDVYTFKKSAGTKG
jgi:PRTRC genetic system protein C